MAVEQIKLSQLRALVAVADRGNFSEAALHLDLSQSAISHAIATLEEELGVRLLSRGRYGAQPTPIGERIIAHGRQVLEILKQMERDAQMERGLGEGRIRIATFRSAAAHLIPPLIARLQARWPGVTVAITEFADVERVEQELRTGRADLGFTELPAPTEFKTWEVMRDEYVVLLPPTTPAIVGAIPWEHLARYPLILVIDNGTCELKLRQLLRTCPQAPQIAYEVKEDSTAVGMVIQGLGVTIMPRLAAEPVPTGIKTCSLPEPLHRVIGVAVVEEMLHSPAVYAFLDALQEHHPTDVPADGIPTHSTDQATEIVNFTNR